MKLTEIIYYSRRMKNKKISENLLIIIALLLPLIMLMFMILFLSLFYSVEEKINKNDVLLITNISSREKDNSIILNDENEEEIRYTFYLNEFNGLIIDEKKITDENIINDLKNVHIATVDNYYPFLSKTVNDFKDKYNEEVILAGSSFTDKPSEIIVPSDFADKLNISYSNIIGKNITIFDYSIFNYKNIYTFYNYNYKNITDEYQKQSYIALSNFKIVGVFNSKIKEYYRNSDIFFTPYEFFLIKNTDIVPVDCERYEYIDEETGKKVVDSNSAVYNCDIINEINKANNQNKYIALTKMTSINKFTQFDNVNSLYKYYCQNSNFLTIDISSDTKAYLNLKPTFDLINDILFILSFIMLIIVILNILRIENYSVRKNIHFYSLMYKLGLEFKDIKSLNILMILYDYFIAFIISLIVIIPSFIISSSMFGDFYSKQVNGILDYNLPFYIYVLDILFVFLITLLIIIIISVGTISKYKNKLTEMRK